MPDFLPGTSLILSLLSVAGSRVTIKEFPATPEIFFQQLLTVHCIVFLVFTPQPHHVKK